MSKQVFKIDRFEKGILFAAGTSGEYLADTSYALVPGGGFFIFPSDYTRPASNAVAIEKETEFYVYTYGPHFFIYDIVSTVWDGAGTTFDLSEKSILLGTDSSSDSVIKPIFYYGAGALRVGDANYTNNANDRGGFKNRWFGHIKRSLFPAATASNIADEITNHNRWHVDDQELIPPTLGAGANNNANYHDLWTAAQGSTIAGSVHFDNAGGNVAAPLNDDFLKIWVDSATNANGTWDINQANYKFYLSYIY